MPRTKRLTSANCFPAPVGILLLLLSAAAAETGVPREGATTLPHGSFSSAMFTQDGRYLLTAADDGAQLWDLQTGDATRRFYGHSEQVRTAVFSPDGRQVLTGAGRQFDMGIIPRDCTARLWDVETGEEVKSFLGHGALVHTALFSPDGERVLTASRDYRAILWDVKTGKPLFVLSDLPYPPPIAFSPNGDTLLGLRTGDRRLRLWDATSGDEMLVIHAGDRFFRSATFSPNGQLILTGYSDGATITWNAETGEQVRVFKGHTGEVIAALFAFGGARIFTGSRDSTVRLWDAETGNELDRFRHPGPVNSLLISSDGSRALTKWQPVTAANVVDTDKDFVSLWDTTTGREIRQLRLPNIYQRNIAIFSPDGKRVLVTLQNTTLLDAETGRTIREYK